MSIEAAVGFLLICIGVYDIACDVSDRISERIKKEPQRFICYKVKRGDTLYSITKKYGVTIEEIMKYNTIKNRNLIYEGETLIIPNKKWRRNDG